MVRDHKLRQSPSDRLKNCLASDKVIIKRVKEDMFSLLSSIGSDISRLEKLQRYYLDLLNRTRLYEEQLLRLEYDYKP